MNNHVNFLEVHQRFNKILFHSPWSLFNLMISIIVASVGAYFAFVVDFMNVNMDYIRPYWYAFYISSGIIGIMVTLFPHKPSFWVRFSTQIALTFCLFVFSIRALAIAIVSPAFIVYGVLALFSLLSVLVIKHDRCNE